MSEEMNEVSSLLDPTQEQQQESQQTQDTQQSQDTQPEPASPAAESQQQQAPESYEPFTAPEGFSITDEQNGELVELGKEMKLNQTQMQRLVDFGAKKIGDGMEAMRLEIIKRWRHESEHDSEITAGIDHARRLISNIGDEKFRADFRAMINETGIGDNPLFIRFCIQTGKLLGEDAFIKQGNNTNPNSQTLAGIAHSLYPDM
ncbi:MAG: hypothetical protein LBS45_00170 [Synergistaceae bacterium]|jgi:hypothetical protein|nr:hypothetical protein [Synergistaceae bacterium]